jgi:UDP-N-acetylglucosamine--N-acetylmuramyl-(pentapeptide) pyrophosphoryl-undecaprenol N-acetylglucosamine transferase
MKHCVIVAGGTGGHVYPALAFAANWQAQGHRVTWIGTQQGLEASIVPKHNIPLHFIQVKGVRRSGKIAQFFSLLGAARAFFQAITLLKQLQPNIVLGMGGYVSGPSVLAARCLKIPVVIHEQNAIAGKTNQLAARFVQKVLTAFPGVLTQYQPIVCGNPVRADLITLQPKRYMNTPMRVLIVGGSRGALSLNKMLPGLLMHIENIEIWHQTGEKHFEDAKIIYSQIEEGRPPLVPTPKITPYIDDMCAAYEWADVVICRSGAMTVFEIMAVGRPAIFIPYPYAVDDHQTANANYLVEKCAAMLIQEKDLTLETLKPLLDALKEDLNYQRYARNAYANRVIDADSAVVKACLEVVQ